MSSYKKHSLDCYYVKDKIKKYGVFELDNVDDLAKQIYEITQGGIYISTIRHKVVDWATTLLS